MTSISAWAVVETEAIGEDVAIAEFAVVRPNVRIGNRAVIYPHVVIESGARVGDNVEIFPGAYIGKSPKGAGALSRAPRFEAWVDIGTECSIGPHAVIFYDVSLGAGTLIGDGASIREQSRIGSKTVVGRYVTVNYNTRIGDRVRVQDHTWLAGNMTIEDDVFISGGVGTSNEMRWAGTATTVRSCSGPTSRAALRSEWGQPTARRQNRRLRRRRRWRGGDEGRARRCARDGCPGENPTTAQSEYRGKVVTRWQFMPSVE